MPEWNRFQANRFNTCNSTSGNVAGTTHNRLYMIKGREIFAYDLTSGSEQWHTSGASLAAGFIGALSLDGNTVYSPIFPKDLRATNTADGSSSWVASTSGAIRGISIDYPSGQARIYTGDLSGNYYAFDASGALVWAVPGFSVTGASGDFSQIVQTPTVLPDHNVVIGGETNGTFLNGMLKKIDYTNGNVIWSCELGYTPYDSQSVVDASGNLYIVVSTSGTLFSIDSGGGINWISASSGFAQSMTPALDSRGHLYADTFFDGLICIDTSSGDVVWSVSDGVDNASPALSTDENTVYIAKGAGTNANELIAVYASSGIIKWSTNVSGWASYSAPSIDNSGYIYTGSDQRGKFAPSFLTKVEPVSGIIVWQNQAAGTGFGTGFRGMPVLDGPPPPPPPAPFFAFVVLDHP